MDSAGLTGCDQISTTWVTWRPREPRARSRATRECSFLSRTTTTRHRCVKGFWAGPSGEGLIIVFVCFWDEGHLMDKTDRGTDERGVCLRDHLCGKHTFSRMGGASARPLTSGMVCRPPTLSASQPTPCRSTSYREDQVTPRPSSCPRRLMYMSRIKKKKILYNLWHKVRFGLVLRLHSVYVFMLEIQGSA